MKKCMYCGCENEDSALICRECGISFEYYESAQGMSREEAAVLEGNAGYDLPSPSRKSPGKKTLGDAADRRKVGGLVAFTVFALLLSHMGADRMLADYLLVRLACLLPGLEALRRAVNAGCAPRREEQERSETLALVLGVVALVLGLCLLLIDRP